MTKDQKAWNDLLYLITNRRQFPMAGYLMPYESQSIGCRMAIDTLLRLGLIDEFDPLRWRAENPPHGPKPYLYTGRRAEE